MELLMLVRFLVDDEDEVECVDKGVTLVRADEGGLAEIEGYDLVDG